MINLIILGLLGRYGHFYLESVDYMEQLIHQTKSARK